MGWSQCFGGSASYIKPTFTETQLVDNPTQETSFTFATDYHNFDFVRIEFTDTTLNEVNFVIVTPDTIDAIFQLTSYFTVDRLNSNHYASYTQSNLTWERSNYYFRSTIITAVYGMTCNMTVTEDELYQASSLGTDYVTVTTQNKVTDYDWIMMVGNSDDVTEIIPNIPIFVPLYEGIGTISQRYPGIDVVSTTEYTISGGRFFRVSGIKFS